MARKLAFICFQLWKASKDTASRMETNGVKKARVWKRNFLFSTCLGYCKQSSDICKKNNAFANRMCVYVRDFRFQTVLISNHSKDKTKVLVFQLETHKKECHCSFHHFSYHCLLLLKIGFALKFTRHMIWVYDIFNYLIFLESPTYIHSSQSLHQTHFIIEHMSFWLLQYGKCGKYFRNWHVNFGNCFNELKIFSHYFLFNRAFIIGFLREK